MLQQIDIARLMKNRCARMSNPSFGFKVIDVPVPHGKLFSAHEIQFNAAWAVRP
jgi:hypothetical protein